METRETPVLCFVSGKSGTGKTTLLEKVIKEIVQRGYQVGAIKSDVHSFEVDTPGKDSWRFYQAGARTTAIIGNEKYALIERTEQKKELDEIIGLIRGVDIILIEGFKASDKARIEVVRAEMGGGIISPGQYLTAVATDIEGFKARVPVFGLNDYSGIADFIIAKFL